MRGVICCNGDRMLRRSTRISTSSDFSAARDGLRLTFGQGSAQKIPLMDIIEHVCLPSVSLKGAYDSTISHDGELSDNPLQMLSQM